MIYQDDEIEIHGMCISDYKPLCVLVWCKELLLAAQKIENDKEFENIKKTNVLIDGDHAGELMDKFTSMIVDSKCNLQLLYNLSSRLPIIRSYYNAVHNAHINAIDHINSLTPMYLCLKLLEPYVNKGIIVFNNFNIVKLRIKYTWKSSLSKERRVEMDDISVKMLDAINKVSSRKVSSRKKRKR